MYELYTGGFSPVPTDSLGLVVLAGCDTCSEEICSIQIAISRIVVVVGGGGRPFCHSCSFCVIVDPIAGKRC